MTRKGGYIAILQPEEFRRSTENPVIDVSCHANS